MTRTSATVMLATLLMLAVPVASGAQGVDAPPPGTNSAGTAQSSAKTPNRDSGTTTGSAGMGSGRATTPPITTPDAAIKNENNLLDHKLKGICRGC
jgi:hypothetical protein